MHNKRKKNGGNYNFWVCGYLIKQPVSTAEIFMELISLVFHRKDSGSVNWNVIWSQDQMGWPFGPRVISEYIAMLHLNTPKASATKTSGIEVHGYNSELLGCNSIHVFMMA